MHDVRSPSACPSLPIDTQFTRTIQLTCYGGATFGTVCHCTTRPYRLYLSLSSGAYNGFAWNTELEVVVKVLEDHEQSTE